MILQVVFIEPRLSWRHRITVDGRNPAPVDMVNIPLFTWFYTSQVMQDFYHQQYHFPTGPCSRSFCSTCLGAIWGTTGVGGKRPTSTGERRISEPSTDVFSGRNWTRKNCAAILLWVSNWSTRICIRVYFKLHLPGNSAADLFGDCENATL